MTDFPVFHPISCIKRCVPILFHFRSFFIVDLLRDCFAIIEEMLCVFPTKHRILLLAILPKMAGTTACAKTGNNHLQLTAKATLLTVKCFSVNSFCVLFSIAKQTPLCSFTIVIIRIIIQSKNLPN